MEAINSKEGGGKQFEFRKNHMHEHANMMHIHVVDACSTPGKMLTHNSNALKTTKHTKIFCCFHRSI